MSSAAAFDPLRPRRPGGMGRGAMLALMVHAGLLIAIAFGVSWRSSEPTGATAELWAAVPEVAAPAAVAPPMPAPVPKPYPKVEPPPPKPEVREAEIALEKAKAAEKAREEREKADAAAKKRAQDEAAEKREREKAEKAAKAAEKAEAERTAKQREENLKRMMGQAGATGAPQSTGTAQRDAGPSPNYWGRIGALIRGNLRDIQDVPVGTRAEVEMRAAPDGTILSARITKSSGNKDWDNQVLRAIDTTGVLPRDTDGRVPPVIPLGFTR